MWDPKTLIKFYDEIIEQNILDIHSWKIKKQHLELIRNDGVKIIVLASNYYPENVIIKTFSGYRNNQRKIYKNLIPSEKMNIEDICSIVSKDIKIMI